MGRKQTAIAHAAVVIAVALSVFLPAILVAKQPPAGVVNIRVDLPNKSRYGENYVDGPVLIGPQEGLIIDWRIRYSGAGLVSVPAPPEFIRLRVLRDGVNVPIRLSHPDHMTVAGVVGPIGATALEDGTVAIVRSLVERGDGRRFEAGVYRFELEIEQLGNAGSGTGHEKATVDSGFPIHLWIQPLDSPRRLYHHHLIEAAFHTREGQSERALEHRRAIVGLPNTDRVHWLALGENYAVLGRHSQAVDAFRRVLPNLSSTPAHVIDLLRQGERFRRMAASFAVVGDRPTAEGLLRMQGVPESEISVTIEQLRQKAVRPRG
jgi:hypothetical protein